MSLKISNLSVSVDNKQIINGLDLEIHPGEIHALMGPNGSGKSSLSLTLMGHPAYEVGKASRVTLDNQDLLDLSPDERSALGLFLAFQHPVEVFGVRVMTFLRAIYKIKSEEKGSTLKKFKTALEFRRHTEELAKEYKVKKELLNRNLNENFSGGEKKRLEILQMALLAPKYAFLDETDSGLDVDALRAVAAGIKKINQEHNTGMVIITHYQRILQYLDLTHVHIMKEGKIVRSGGSELVDLIEKQGYK